jgi:RNA polymerase sigma-70 factor (ECF subfamily)
VNTDRSSHRADPAAASPDSLVGPTAPSLSLSSSFEDFFEMEHTGLFSALCLIAGDRRQAEDIMQEAFLKIWERWSLVQSLANPTGYLYRTAMNEFRMGRRRAAVAARRTLRRPRRTDDIELAATRHDIERGLAALKPRQRAAIVLTVVLEFSTSEAADTLGMKPATVRKLTQRARETLRRVLGDLDG